MDRNEIIDQLTLEEKASLCSGSGFWETQAIKRLAIPQIRLADGPHGLRKQDDTEDHLGMNAATEAVCFPTASATASSWDRDLLYDIGQALALACNHEGVGVLLGPGANIKRSPLCGRNFEYISEDPYLTGKMAAAFIRGVQNNGVGTSIKHFAANNQEHRRMTIDSVVDERTLREIYLTGFEIAIKESNPWTVMCAYNKLNGVYCSDNKYLLTTILRDQWRYQGVVVTDWGACNDRVEGIKAGLELEMPSSGGLNDEKIIQAVKDGTLTEAELDKVVFRFLKLVEDAKHYAKTTAEEPIREQEELAYKASVESSVLLKNEGQLLPLSGEEPVLFIGEFFKKPRYQGSGSSRINPTRVVSAFDAVSALGYPFDYEQGYDMETDIPDAVLMQKAVKKASQAKTVVIFAGLTDDYESEAFDREHLNLPMSHSLLIESVAGVNPNVVVVLQNGAPIVMPWLIGVRSVLETYLSGQMGGAATIDLIYGNQNPSGKLAETFPLALEDCPSTEWFRMGPNSVEYREGLYVGYRYFNTFNKEVLFPFGYGLSYTFFEYNKLRVSKSKISENEEVDVYVTVTNTGERAGSEIVQLYVSDVQSTVHRPNMELKGFARVTLKPGERKVVKMTLDRRAFAFYNTLEEKWEVESGDFSIMIGKSSDYIVLVDYVEVKGSDKILVSLKDLLSAYHNREYLNVSDATFKRLLGRKPPNNHPYKQGHFTLNATVGDIKHTLAGRVLYKIGKGRFNEMAKDHDKSFKKLVDAMIEDTPLRSIVLMSRGKISFRKINAVLHMVNGRLIKGSVDFIKSHKNSKH
ncbi:MULTISPECIES: glycoside hydrolase family 3 C-terminal domain-containing protein [unclassified Fusibacter]|uniref:glycoside hydrolase family 3 C-terminal domain-containing protein n=1 Tax=unclassified Fusibacter TaxID=2624464 RepID=UPI001011AE76|nr:MULTISPECIES: glycoside hydrolase family 3 C-terminal domain-containing protein [unclassified Fusibacter]MCK8061608.1 glycoside hydrolase family 3 C-terminal domain-containing protein [Fusibacter sp. A2]NPE23791.1 glycosyl hydrolase [Fusibacter sp. A1]RXV58696.1 glycosyl hydrolase [Fusibacter sp. A1]